MPLTEITQTGVNRQLFLFMERVPSYSSPLDQARRERIKDGCCHGFSFLHLAAFMLNLLPIWNAIMRVIYAYEPTRSNLESLVELPGIKRIFSVRQLYEWLLKSTLILRSHS